MTTVREIMDPDPVTVGPDAPVQEVVSTLREHELSGVPVVSTPVSFVVCRQTPCESRSNT